MKFRPLGPSGIQVSRLWLGTMMFGAWGNPDHEECIAIVNRALDLGINAIDTADVYSDGEAEVIVGQAVKHRRDSVVLATKFGRPMGSGRDFRGASRRWIVRACEASLRRLQTDRIDLYQVHLPDPDTAIDETLSALSDLIHDGKVLAIGTSSFAASELVEAQWVAERRRRERFIAEQPAYSLLVRAAEADVFPTCQRYGLGVVTSGPLASGWLSGRWRHGVDPSSLTSRRAGLLADRFDLGRPENQRKLDAADALGRLADEAGHSLIHLAIAFALNHPAVSAAIIGPRTYEHLAAQVDAWSVRLTEDILDRIDDIVAPGTNFALADSGTLPVALRRSRARRSV